MKGELVWAANIFTHVHLVSTPPILSHSALPMNNKLDKLVGVREGGDLAF